MSRIDANITKQKRRRHSSEPSPNSILTPDHKPLREKKSDSDLHIDLLEMQGDNSVLSPHVSVSSENSAKAPAEKHSFDEKQSLFTDDDVQQLVLAVKNLMLDDLRKERRQDRRLCINNATSPLCAAIQQVKQKQIKSTSVRDGKIFITDKADNRKIITCEDELNAILNTGCVNQDRTCNISLSLPPP